MLWMMSVLSNPLIRMILPYVLGAIGVFAAYKWAEHKGYQKCQLEIQKVREQIRIHAHKEAMELRREKNELNRQLEILEQEAERDPFAAECGISDDSGMRLNKIR